VGSSPVKVLVTQNARIFGGDARNVEAGEVLELDEAEGADLVNSGNAELVTEAAPPISGPTTESPPEVYATPAALEHAQALGVDIAAIRGTGKDGKVTKGDVEAAVAAKEGI
jgi:2-oxoglutarate dehydrogenase E2 component (dihydrolipoamide succinyltransferase)